MNQESPDPLSVSAAADWIIYAAEFWNWLASIRTSRPEFINTSFMWIRQMKGRRAQHSLCPGGSRCQSVGVGRADGKY